MKKLLTLLLAGAVLIGCSNTNNRDVASVKADLEKNVPGLPHTLLVKPTKVNNLYEVSIGRKVFYTTSDGKYLIFGNLIDAVSKHNLTEERTVQLSKIDWNKLPLDLAIKEVNGTGKRKLAIFSDPDCPYCQMFEQQVAPKLKDTTIYVFLFPLPNHPNSKPYSLKIWCSSDRAATWTSWMRDKNPLKDAPACDTSGIDTIYKFGNEVVQIEGTPTLILENGQILPGMLPAEELLQQMDKVASK